MRLALIPGFVGPELQFEHPSYMLNESAIQTISEDVCVTLVGPSELVLLSPIQITFSIRDIRAGITVV